MREAFTEVRARVCARAPVFVSVFEREREREMGVKHSEDIQYACLLFFRVLAYVCVGNGWSMAQLMIGG